MIVYVEQDGVLFMQVTHQMTGGGKPLTRGQRLGSRLPSLTIPAARMQP